jgi:broad-specificity NMP kinase
MSKIKENLLGYEHEPSDWIEESAHVMVDELIEYQVYCMSLSELTSRVAKQMRDEYYSNSYTDMTQKYNEAFPNE